MWSLFTNKMIKLGYIESLGMSSNYLLYLPIAGYKVGV